jgi:hypothetical protein
MCDHSTSTLTPASHTENMAKWDEEKKLPQVDASSEYLEYPNPQNGQRQTIRTVKNNELCG